MAEMFEVQHSLAKQLLGSSATLARQMWVSAPDVIEEPSA